METQSFVEILAERISKVRQTGTSILRMTPGPFTTAISRLHRVRLKRFTPRRRRTLRQAGQEVGRCGSVCGKSPCEIPLLRRSILLKEYSGIERNELEWKRNVIGSRKRSTSFSTTFDTVLQMIFPD